MVIVVTVTFRVRTPTAAASVNVTDVTGCDRTQMITLVRARAGPRAGGGRKHRRQTAEAPGLRLKLWLSEVPGPGRHAAAWPAARRRLSVGGPAAAAARPAEA